MIRGFSLLLGLVFIAPTVAGEKPRFAIDSATDSRAGCKILGIAPDGWRVEQALTKLTLSNVVSVRQEGASLPPLLRRDFVLLTNGDRLPLDPTAGAAVTDERLYVWPHTPLGNLHGSRLGLYLPNVVLVFWSLPDGHDEADFFYANLAAEMRKRDVAYLRNGDRVEGTLTTLSGKVGCQITTLERKLVTITWSKLAGIAFSTDRQAKLRTKKAYYRAVLAGGARLNFTDLQFDDMPRRWVGKTQFGPTIDVPEGSLLAADVRQGHAVQLADLTPLRYEHRPFLGVAWPLSKDTAVTGHPLQVAGNIFEKGVAMHAPAEAVYKLDGQYARFDCEVGLDEMHARRGRVRLALRLDGKRIDLNEGKELTSSSAPLHLRLDVRGVRELALIAEVGSFGDVQAHVNWAGARLIKRP